MTETATLPVDLAAPATRPLDEPAPGLAEGVELLGEYQGSGLQEPPYLLRQGDGRIIQVSRLLHLIALNLDGTHDFRHVAEKVSTAFGRPVSAANVDHLIDHQLRPLGVTADGVPQPPARRSVLALTWRSALVPPKVVRALAALFRPLFAPVIMVAVVAGLVAFDVWLFTSHGIGAGLLQVIQQPELQLALSAVIFATGAFHELGHASACRYGGVEPGAIGVGVYLVWPVFYNDVTDSYRLDRAGRLRTDFGGVYFDATAVLVVAGAYFVTGFEPLILVAVGMQLEATRQFLPFLRFDGYYILSDLTGVPDLFTQVKPILASIWRRGPNPALAAMRPRVRRIVTVWVLATTVFLISMVTIFVVHVPKYIPKAWSSFLGHVGDVQTGFQQGSVSGVFLSTLRVGILALPVVGGLLVFTKLVSFGVRAARRRAHAKRDATDTVGERSDAGAPRRPPVAVPVPPVPLRKGQRLKVGCCRRRRRPGRHWDCRRRCRWPPRRCPRDLLRRPRHSLRGQATGGSNGR